MPKPHTSYIDHVMELLGGLGQVQARAMFSGTGIYMDGVIFAIVVKDILYFKVSDNNRADYEAEECQPFTYMNKGKKVHMSYWEVPLRVMEDVDELRQWVQKACAAALRTQQSRKKQKPRLIKG